MLENSTIEVFYGLIYSFLDIEARMYCKSPGSKFILLRLYQFFRYIMVPRLKNVHAGHTRFTPTVTSFSKCHKTRRRSARKWACTCLQIENLIFFLIVDTALISYARRLDSPVPCPWYFYPSDINIISFMSFTYYNFHCVIL